MSSAILCITDVRVRIERLSFWVRTRDSTWALVSDGVGQVLSARSARRMSFSIGLSLISFPPIAQCDP